MTKRKSVWAVCAIIVTSLFVTPVVAHEDITLSVDQMHVVLAPGEVFNLTLTIENGGDSIEDFNVSADSSNSLWSVVPSQPLVEDVFPTWSKNTTLIISLDYSALPSDSTSVNITVTESDANISSSIAVSYTHLTLPTKA